MNRQEIDEILNLKESIVEFSEKAAQQMRGLHHKLHYLYSHCDHKTPEDNNAFSILVGYQQGIPVFICKYCRQSKEDLECVISETSPHSSDTSQQPQQ